MLAKVCLVGPKGAGKSTLTSRIDSAALLEQTVNSGAVFANCNVLVGNKTVDLQISDVSGEDKLRCMGPIYFKRAVAAMCVFDLSSENSFDALGSYIKSVKDNAVDECVLVVVGNKLDLGNRRVTKERGNKFAASVGGKYFEVSAVSGIGVGKSTIASKFDKDSFSKLLRGTALVHWNMVIGNYKVDLQIWDTCGEDRFRCMGPIFYKATNAAVCMFDIASKQSFLDVQAWVVSVQQNAMDECVLVLLGNKLDLGEQREVTKKEALKYAESVGATYFEICALSGEGVTDVFHHIAVQLLHLHDCYSSYHAKLAITSSGMGVCGCTQQQRSRKKWRSGKHSSCFPCLIMR